MLYDQTSNTCIGISTANLWEKKGGKIPTAEQVRDWYIANGITKEGKVKGTNVRTFFRTLESSPLGEITIKNYLKNVQLIWKQGLKRYEAPPLAIWEKLKSGLFIFCIPQKMKRTKNHYLIRGTGDVTKGHAIAMDSLIDGHFKAVKLENSKGPDFGDKGYMYLSLVDLKEIVREIWRIDF